MTQKTKKSKFTIPTGILVLLCAAALLRIILGLFCKGFTVDVSCFVLWARRVYDLGFGEFYSPNYFADYPPGYMYILYLIGGIYKLFGVEYLSSACLLLIKMPAILCDLAIGYLVYDLASKRFNPNVSLVLSALFLFNPAILMNSSIWGQVDSVYTLVIILICLQLEKGKMIPSYFLFILGVLLKPQTLIFAPLILMGIFEHVFLKNFNRKNFFKNLIGGCLSLATFAILSLPFGFRQVLEKYTTTLGSYQYVSVNAYNIWTLFGLNWTSQNKEFLFLTYKTWGTILLVAITLLSLVFFYLWKERKERYYLSGAFLMISVFIFSVRMHERYMFAGVVLLLFAYLVSENKNYLYSYLALSACHFLNVWHVLNFYDPTNFNPRATGILLISLLTVLSGAYFYSILFRKANTGAPKSPAIGILEPHPPIVHKKSSPLDKKDYIAMIAITLFYACFAFSNLGSMKAPITNHHMDKDSGIIVDLAAVPSSVAWYLGYEPEVVMELYEPEGDSYRYLENITFKQVFCWGSTPLNVTSSRLVFRNTRNDANIGEMVFLDENGKVIPVLNESTYPALFDELDTFPEEITHLSGTYFDEIYYSRTVYEMIHGLRTYENTHPPLGKVLMIIGVKLFGTTPFGFRFMGTLFGVLMLPFMYLLGRKILGNTYLAALVSFVFAFDFMHFTQTRLGTIDVYVTFFIILMYYFMAKYCRMNFYRDSLKDTFIPLGLCGIAFGLGVASKWTGAYAGVGLAIIFFRQLWHRYQEYNYALAKPDTFPKVMPANDVTNKFKRNTIQTILFCMIFFVVIPFFIYLFSYIPFVDNINDGLLARMLENQKNMFNYHSNLDATHPYSSIWYEWPTIKRPMFLYSKTYENGLRRGISTFGNPFIWWVGIPAFVVTAFCALKYKCQNAAFLCVGYLAQFLPWVFVSRCTFIYHYFPSTPFVVLMIGYCIKVLSKKLNKKCLPFILFGYGAAVFFLFLYFYPVLSGELVEASFVKESLRWLDGWVLTLS